MTFNINKNCLKYLMLLLFLFVFVFALLQPIKIAPDSAGYLNMQIIRSAAYPIFLNILKNIFGLYFNIATVFFQVSLGIFSVYFFISKLKKHLTISSIWLLLLTGILLVPYFYSFFIANRFLSEALAYPLYLVSVAQFISILISEKTKDFLYAFPVLFLLIMTRSQFVFMIPVGIIMLLYIMYKNKSYKQNAVLLLIFLCFPFITSIADKTYHKIKHGYYVNTPWTGIVLISPAFYVADKEDFQIFNTEEEQVFFKKTYLELSKKKLNTNHLTSKIDNFSPFKNNYPEIANHTVLTIGEELTSINLNRNEKYIAIDKLTKKMSAPLILNNFQEWSTIYIKNIINAFGNTKTLLLYTILFVFFILKPQKKKTDKGKIITLTLLLTLFNICLVAIGIITLKRFTFYNNWVLFLIIFMLLDTFNAYNTKYNED